MRLLPLLVVLAACGGKAHSDDAAPSGPAAPDGPAPCNVPSRDFGLKVVMLEANCTGEITVSADVMCEFDETAICMPRAFWCTFPDGSRARHESGPGPWLVKHDYDSLLCDVTYDVSFPSL